MEQVQKVTEDQIKSRIKLEQYFQPTGTTLTICFLQMANGFWVIGHSACVDPKGFDSQIGRTIAYQNAVEQIWKLEGYLLAERRHERSTVVPKARLAARQFPS